MAEGVMTLWNWLIYHHNISFVIEKFIAFSLSVK